MLGRMNRLEVHHIFPKSQLYKRNIRKSEVNALANFCFLTKDTNLDISDRLPEAYFPEIEKAHPGALPSQWIPADRDLWKIENFRLFLEARKRLLADEVNRRVAELLHGDERWLAGPAAPPSTPPADLGGVATADEERELEAVNAWIEAQGLPRGIVAYDLADPDTGQQRAVFDLAWPNGIQEELTRPVCLLLNEGNEVFAVANQAGYRCFVSAAELKRYVQAEILAGA